MSVLGSSFGAVTWGRLAAAIDGAAGAPQRGLAAHWARPNHLAAIDALGDFFGLQGDMIPPTRAEAMSVPAMARARHTVCIAARLPLNVDPADYPATALIERPDPNRTRQAVHTDTLDSLLFHGTALWRITERYAADARPRRAEFIALHRTAREPDGRWLIDGTHVADADLIWFEGPHEGVLAFGGRSMRAAVRLDRAYAATAANPAVAFEVHQVSGDVLTDEEIADVVAEVRAAIADRGVVYTNEALQLVSHAASAENLLISGRQAAAVDIARMVGLPAPMVDAYPPGASSEYQNFQARMKEARDIGVDAYASAIEARLSMDDVLPRGVTCSYDWDNMLRADFKDRMEGYTAAQTAGVYSAEECRAMELGRPEEGQR
jgi:hypothetical protein